VVGAGEIDLARHDAGGQHHFVEAGQVGGADLRAQPQHDAGFFQPWRK
jgi:hypothetical protein